MARLKVDRRAIGVVALLVLAGLLWFATRPPPLTVQGEVSSDRVDISPRVSGRVATLAVDVGDSVEKGTVIAELESPQLVAALEASKAALQVAQADLDRVASIRPETVDARRADLATVTADVNLYQQEYNRQVEPARNGNTSKQKVDEATRNLESAVRRRQAAEAALQLAIQGASSEERELAEAQVKQAQAAVNQRQVDVAELTIHAPISSQVTTRIAELGENFSAGAPLMSLIDIKNVWFTFNVREDLLAGLKIGDTFDLTVPAMQSKVIQVKVTMINVQGQFATWRATRATGDFDLRTFEVRAVPVQPIDGLRPGMSAVATWNHRGR